MLLHYQRAEASEMNANTNCVFLIHGREGKPDNHWFPWLSLELKARGFEVNAPQMPVGTRIYAEKERRWTQMPKVKEWLSFLKEYVGTPNKNTYFVGHSLGCIAIARYLAALSAKAKVGGCVFVAGFSGRLEIPEISEFYSLPFNLEKAKLHCDKFVTIFSDNDPYVPIERSIEFAKQLGAKTILERGKGHFTTRDNVTALLSVLNVLVRMSNS